MDSWICFYLSLPSTYESYSMIWCICIFNSAKESNCNFFFISSTQQLIYRKKFNVVLETFYLNSKSLKLFDTLYVILIYADNEWKVSHNKKNSEVVLLLCLTLNCNAGENCFQDTKRYRTWMFIRSVIRPTPSHHDV